MLKKIDHQLFDEMFKQAENSSRRRSHYNFHSDLEDPVQRLCVALKKDSYVRPHKHPAPKWEMFIVLNGAIQLHIYDNQGVLIDKLELSSGSKLSGIEIPAETWHTLIPVNSDAVIMEFKQGPYIPAAPEDFACWAPVEEDVRVTEYMAWAETAEIGDKFA